MKLQFLQIPVIVVLILLVNATAARAQYKIRGTVYDSSHNYPIGFVSVLSTSGRGTITNALGEYEIEVAEKDSIWFSYLNKPTVKFAVLKIITPFSFDIALQISVPVLKEVKIRPRNYRQDSIQNREDYAKIFNYKKPGIRVVSPQYGAAAGFDVNEIINVFRFKRNRSIRSFQDRLLAQEEEKFVDHRFSKALVRRLTLLTGSELDSFMLVFRPPYPFAVMASDYDFQKYIKESFERFKEGLPPQRIWKEAEESF